MFSKVLLPLHHVFIPFNITRARSMVFLRTLSLPLEGLSFMYTFGCVFLDIIPVLSFLFPFLPN